MSNHDQDLSRGFMPIHMNLADIDSLQLSRVFRQARTLGLGNEIQSELKAAIGEGFKQEDFDVDGDINSSTWGTRRCELKIRQLVRSDAPWEQLKSFAWKLFRLRGTSEAAAQLVELVYLYGSFHDALDVLAILNEEGYDYYFHLHEKIRIHLALTLWRNQKYETLNLFLVDAGEHQALLDIEHFYIFDRHLQTKDQANAFMYFQKREAILVEAAKKFGDRIGMGEMRLYLTVGQIAVTLGFNKIARRVLEQIRPDHEEYPEAVQTFMLIEVDKSDPASRNYFEKLRSEVNWRERVNLIAKFIDECRTRMSDRDIRRPALNDILTQPLKWVPALPISYAETSKVIAANIDLSAHLPGLTQVFKDNALIFHAPSLDGALWGPLEELVGENGLVLFWRGVAKLHNYINLADANERMLWQAKTDITQAKEKWAFLAPFDWEEAHIAACTWVSKSHHLSEKKRSQMLRQMRVAADSRSLGLKEIEDYLSDANEQPYEVLCELRKFTKEKGAKLLERRVLINIAKANHWTNEALDRVWQLSAELNDFDYAWRAATILEGRDALSEQAVHPWSISGEKRAVYPFYEPKTDILKLCMGNFSDDERKLCHACIKIGPQLPELLAALDSESKAIKIVQPASDSFEASIEKALNKVDWLPAPKKQYRYSFDGILSSAVQLPGFIQILPSNLWSYLFVKLGDRLGLNSWSWQLSKLHKQIEELLPRIASRAGLDDYSTKVAKWLRQLTSEQRSAWHDLAQLSRKFEDNRGVEVFADFLARLAIVINPAHGQALKSLRTMRAPISVIWSLERWIASEEYSAIRLHLQAANRIPVPATLKRSVLQKKIAE